MNGNKNLHLIPTIDWNQVEKALWEVKLRREAGELPVICYYRKAGTLIGSFLCNDDEGDTVLFFNADYPYTATILQLITQHCQFLHEEVAVYPLKTKGIDLYETLTPKNFLSVEL